MLHRCCPDGAEGNTFTYLIPLEASKIGYQTFLETKNTSLFCEIDAYEQVY